MIPVATATGVKLTGREQEVWFCLGSGMNSRQIAEQLSISENTVANHRKSILRKKGLKSLKAYFRAL